MIKCTVAERGVVEPRGIFLKCVCPPGGVLTTIAYERWRRRWRRWVSPTRHSSQREDEANNDNNTSPDLTHDISYFWVLGCSLGYRATYLPTETQAGMEGAAAQVAARMLEVAQGDKHPQVSENHPLRGVVSLGGGAALLYV